VPESDVPDLLGPGLRLVLVGINPGRASAAAAAHFANPRNDFWRLLEASGLTPELLGPERQAEVLRYGIGITNAALRTTPGSGDLRAADFAGSADRLARVAADVRPSVMAFVGKEAYRGAFGERPELGLQPRNLGGTRLFVLPSTSPANAAVGPSACAGSASGGARRSPRRRTRYAQQRRPDGGEMSEQQSQQPLTGEVYDAGGVKIYGWEWNDIGGPRGQSRLPWFGISSPSSAPSCCFARSSRARDRRSLLFLAVGVAFLVSWLVNRGLGSLYPVPSSRPAARTCRGRGRDLGPGVGTLPRRRVPVHRALRGVSGAGWGWQLCSA
jgi:TDG/mug DNA glycosylase family protein